MHLRTMPRRQPLKLAAVLVESVQGQGQVLAWEMAPESVKEWVKVKG